MGHPDDHDTTDRAKISVVPIWGICGLWDWTSRVHSLLRISTFTLRVLNRGRGMIIFIFVFTRVAFS